MFGFRGTNEWVCFRYGERLRRMFDLSPTIASCLDGSGDAPPLSLREHASSMQAKSNKCAHPLLDLATA